MCVASALISRVNNLENQVNLLGVFVHNIERLDIRAMAGKT
ncbi:MAG: hypothetical protein Phog2KO_50620 [Phototrophicaceae bacterium]